MKVDVLSVFEEIIRYLKTNYRSPSEVLLGKYAANLQENIHAEVRFQ